MPVHDFVGGLLGDVDLGAVVETFLPVAQDLVKLHAQQKAQRDAERARRRAARRAAAGGTSFVPVGVSTGIPGTVPAAGAIPEEMLGPALEMAGAVPIAGDVGQAVLPFVEGAVALGDRWATGNGIWAGNGRRFPGSFPRRPRMNPLNLKATTRAIRRIRSSEKLCRKIFNFSTKKTIRKSKRRKVC